MTVTVTETNLDPTTFVLPSSRYASSVVIFYGEDGIITFNTYKKQQLAENADDQFALVLPGEEFRPDKTSRRAYGTTDFWWRILEANNIKDVFDYKAGLNIRIPSAFGLL